MSLRLRTAGEIMRRTFTKRFEQATTGDIILSVILPGCGIMIGLMALVKGERQRAKTMIAIGAFCLVVFSLIRLIDVWLSIR